MANNCNWLIFVIRQYNPYHSVEGERAQRPRPARLPGDNPAAGQPPRRQRVQGPPVHNRHHLNVQGEPAVDGPRPTAASGWL